MSSLFPETDLIIISSSLVTIGNRAFTNCINLSQQLNFQGDLRTIGVQAFKNCTNINRNRAGRINR